MHKKRGLASKLSMYLLTAVFLVLFALLYYNYIISKNLVLKDAQNDAQKLTELTVAQIENVLTQVENIPTNIANIIENRDTIKFVGTRKVIENVLEGNNLVFGACIAYAPSISGGDTLSFAPYIYNTGDSIVFKDLADSKYRYTEQAWYRDAKDLGRGTWSEPYFDEGGGEVMMATYSVPFYRKQVGNKVFAGVVTADLSLSGLQSMIKRVQFYDSGEGFLLSSTGNIVIWPEIDIADRNTVHNVFDYTTDPEMRNILAEMISGGKEVISLKGIGNQINKHKWMSYAKVPSTQWSLGIIFNEDELYTGLDTLYFKLVSIGLGGFILVAILIFVIARRFVKPIEKLAFATRKIGAGEFNFTIPAFRSQDEIAELGRSFGIMQKELKEYIRNLKETTAANEKIQSELNIAASIQQQMLPGNEILRGVQSIDYYGILRPARQIGGDLYDFILIGEYLYFTIGDVAGKGIPAALFMAKTLTLFRAKVDGKRDPAEIAEAINHDLCLYNEQAMFVTCFIGKLHIPSAKLLYTNAGHNIPYLLDHEKGTEVLKGAHGLPLGTLPDLTYEQELFELHKDQKIILYTDGITEADNAENMLYGNQRFENFLTKHQKNSPEDLAKLIVADVDKFASGAEQSDDITLLILDI